MTALDRLIPTPRMLDIDHIDLAAPPERVWELVRHSDLARSRIARALFAIRALPGHLAGTKAEEPTTIKIDDLASSPEHPGFQILSDDPPHEVAVGAIGKVWQGEIPFVHVANADAFAAFQADGFVKVAWAIRVCARGERDARVEIEVRVDATDDASWRKFRRYFRLIGPASRFIRRSALAAFARELGTPDARENDGALAGDELLADAGEQVTQFIDVAASPAAIWPWLVQMGCRRAGFYSIDALDNGGRRSAREVHPELQRVAVGDVLPATPEGDDGFEVLIMDEPHALILGGLYDVDGQRQLPFAALRPSRFWQVTWAFVLEPLDEKTTRVHVRGRAAFPSSVGLHATWIRFVHHFMQEAQLRHLAARVEGRLPHDDLRDVLEGIGGAAIMTAGLLTPFLRERRCRWGVSEADAARAYPGDNLVPTPLWSFTHGVEIDARAGDVWPWLSQIGATRAGFYSYQWLEDIARCDLHNAETIHPEWELREGDPLVLQPKMPPLVIVSVERGHHFIAQGPIDERARAEGRPWVTVSWLFLVEPLGPARCRVISRYRAAASDDIVTRLSFGPTLLEPVAFAMDRRMLLGLKERALGNTPPAQPVP